MRQALIVGARPMFVKGRTFPKVPLGAGGWRIEVENRKDSKVRLTIYRQIAGDASGMFDVPSVVEINDDNAPKLIDGPVTISAEIYEAGREPFINVFAVALNGAKE